MKEKIKIDIEYVKLLYDNGNSYHKIAKIIGCSFTKIQKELNSYNYNLNNPYKIIDDKIIVAICKKTNKEILDYENKSGAITSHLLEIYPDIKIPTHYKRKDILYKTFKYWYDDYFYFEYQEMKKKIKCKYCNWETQDYNNKAGSYMNHIINDHKINIEKHLIDYPLDKNFFKNYIINKDREDFLNKKENNIECKVCKKKFKKITQTHLNLHDLNINQYIEKYNIIDLSEIISKKSYEIMLDNRKKFFYPKKIYKRSNAEKEIIDILLKYNLNLKINDRTILDGFESDILVKDNKILIEYNGVYYHSENKGKKDNKYHYNKMMLANKKGYGIIQIFEDEWLFKKDIVISKLLHILKLKTDEKIYARKCEIKTIKSSIKNKFLNEYHIQGEDKSIIKLGSYYNNELVAVMTFDNKRTFNKTHDHNSNIYELKRFATKLNVIGIASKLLRFFIKTYNPDKIISFADLRWTINKDNNLYTKIGFKINKILKPDYTYVQYKGINKNKRLHKFAYGKSSLKNKFPDIYSDNKTEWEIMQEAGYDRIWDCGKVKYELIIK